MLLCPEGKTVIDLHEMDEIIGKIHQAPPKLSGLMFNRPSDIAVHKHTGDLFISVSYGSSCVHHLRADGTHIKSWGKSGTDPGLFNLPNSICIDYGTEGSVDHVMVADRENQRVSLSTLTVILAN